MSRLLRWGMLGFGWMVVVPLRGQTDDLHAWLADCVESGRLDAGEAEAIRSHIATSGWPLAPEEIGAIPGVTASSAATLARDPTWRSFCAADPIARAAATRHTLEVRTDLRWADSLWSSVRAGRSGAWALRRDQGGHLSGHLLLRAPRRPLHLLLGDHTLRWAQGAVTGSVGAFDGLREPTAAFRATVPVVAACASPSTPVRSGLAALYDGRRWRAALSCATPAATYPLRAALLVSRTFRIARIGVACEAAPRRAGVVGVHAEGGGGSTVWAAEAAIYPQGRLVHAAILSSRGREFDVFGRITHAVGTHPGRAWGDVRAPVRGPFEAVVGVRWLHPGKNTGRMWFYARLVPDPQFEFEWRRTLAFPGPTPWEVRLTLRNAESLRCELRRDGPVGVCRLRWDVGTGASGMWGWRPQEGPWSLDVWLGRAFGESPFYGFEPGAHGWSTAVVSASEVRLSARVGYRHGPWRLAAGLQTVDATHGTRLPAPPRIEVRVGWK
jgi:hypothetical protein